MVDHAGSRHFRAVSYRTGKTGRDLEWRPSGKFATNDLGLTLGTLAYDILRQIGSTGLIGELSPLRHPVEKKRIRTVMQELMSLVARLVKSGHRLKLKCQ